MGPLAATTVSQAFSSHPHFLNTLLAEKPSAFNRDATPTTPYETLAAVLSRVGMPESLFNRK